MRGCSLSILSKSHITFSELSHIFKFSLKIKRFCNDDDNDNITNFILFHLRVNYF